MRRQGLAIAALILEAVALVAIAAYVASTWGVQTSIEIISGPGFLANAVLATALMGSLAALVVALIGAVSLVRLRWPPALSWLALTILPATGLLVAAMHPILYGSPSGWSLGPFLVSSTALACGYLSVRGHQKPRAAAAANAPHALRTEPKAIASLALGLFGLILWLLLVPQLVGVVLGHLALARTRPSDGASRGRGLAIAGLVLGYLELALFAFAVIGSASGALQWSLP